MANYRCTLSGTAHKRTPIRSPQCISTYGIHLKIRVFCTAALQVKRNNYETMCYCKFFAFLSLKKSIGVPWPRLSVDGLALQGVAAAGDWSW